MALDTGFIAAVVIVIGLLFWARLWDKRENARREPLDSELLFILARIERTSEFEQFRRAAGTWDLSEQRVEDDFKRYLWQGDLPHYVRDHLRRARKLDPELPDKGSSNLAMVLGEMERHRPRTR
ncbi:MAG: hypothetical protein K9J48_01985 [Desulfohalobiaceae bacterium]|nr:hypothetical protein [Desulfohalobiaceae bacterium]